jgi:hypothetical protein
VRLHHDDNKQEERKKNKKVISHPQLLVAAPCQTSYIILISNTHTLKPFKELGLDSQRVKKLASKLHVHSVNFAAKLVHTRRALSSTVINSHLEPVSGQACNPLDPH